MPIPTPNLDDRTFQALVNEAKRRIPRYTPEWTDHNVSDPGITLIELFAWMTEQYLFRLNQLPEKSLRVFLNLMGTELESRKPARGEITFRLTAAPHAERRIHIPRWTAVATERDEGDEVVVYTTDYAAEVLPPRPRWLLTSNVDTPYTDHSTLLEEEKPVTIWSHPPTEGDALYFGFAADLSAHTLVLQLDCEKVGIGIDPLNPPWRWEVWRGDEIQWERVPVLDDSTAGMNESGEIVFRMPFGCLPHRLQMREANVWLRCLPLTEQKSRYARSPRLRRVRAYSIGITVPITHAQPVLDEPLGHSTGEPGQRFQLQHRNVLHPEGSSEVVEVEEAPGQWEAWQQVADFGVSTANDPHYTLDPISGTIEFGPAIRQRDGTEPQFGAIPSRGLRIRMRRYRIGGGQRGNVGTGLVRVLKSTNPYVASVYNYQPISGGLEAQSVEDAVLRAPSRLRTRDRAVTAEDFERLAQQVAGVGQVRCLAPSGGANGADVAAGTVQLLVMPELPPLDEQALAAHIGLREQLPQEARRIGVEEQLRDELRLPPATEQRLHAYLDRRRLLTTRVQVVAPTYLWLSVEARLKATPHADPTRVRQRVKEAIYRFLHPLYGGTAGSGWPFGHPLTIDKLYALIQHVPGVDYATELKLYPIQINAAPGQRVGRHQSVIDVPPDGVIVSYFHNVHLAS
ncbi:MAG: putative baseplate assembly protein [Ardenticatenales bacterium]|nr:putative baseplate assembly protein [Ardenticatenales bacterium]